MRATSTSTLGFFLWTGAVTIASWIATLAARWVQLRKEQRERPLKDAVRESVLPALFEALAITALVLCIWAYFTAKTVLYEHQNETSTVSQLTTQVAKLKEELRDAQQNAEQRCEQQKDRQINGLKKRLGAACYLPDRRLTDRNRDELFHVLKSLKQSNPKIAKMMICQEIPGDIESFNFTQQITRAFRDADWLVIGCDTNVLKGIVQKNLWRGIVIGEANNQTGFVAGRLQGTFFDMGFDIEGGFALPETVLHDTLILVGYKVGYSNVASPW